MKTIPLEINVTLKECPICETWMNGTSSQQIKGVFRKRVINENKIVCSTCGYSETMTQEYSPKTVELIVGE